MYIQLITPVLLILSLLLGIIHAFTSLNRIAFYSGGSGFIVPVPWQCLLIFVLGVSLFISSLLAFKWRIIPIKVVTVLLILLSLFAIQQTVTHPNPMKVLPGRVISIVIHLSISLGLSRTAIRDGVDF